MTDRVANWSVHDPATAGFVAACYDRLRLLIHMDDPTPGARSERYTEPNQDWTVQQEIDRAIALGLKLDVVVDMYFGNGRSEAGGSATGPGRYHHSWTEGGARAALDKVNGWLPWKHVASFACLNEPADKAWLADWYESGVGPKLRQICNQRGVPMVGWDGQHLGPAAKRSGCDVIDVHGIRSSGKQAAKNIKSARRHGLSVWMLEFSGASAEAYEPELEAVLGELRDEEVVGAFPGSSNFASRGTVHWNFKNHYQFNHWYKGGVTYPGELWQKHLGTGTPVEPPPPDPDPIPPPDPEPEVDIERARVQNRKARGALADGRPSNAMGILERQAKSLGMEQG